jgi:hypothetical protein
MNKHGFPRYSRTILFALVLLLVCSLPFGAIIAVTQVGDTFSPAKVSVHFSPKGGATETRSIR